MKLYKKIYGVFLCLSLITIAISNGSTIVNAVAGISAIDEAKDAVFSETRDGVKKMVEAAYGYYKENGREVALKAYNSDNIFKYKSLYVYAVDDKGIIIAHGGDKTLIGSDITKFIDNSGKKFGKDIVAIRSNGWVDYYWVNSDTNNVQMKSTYVMKLEDGVHICAGIYVSE